MNNRPTGKYWLWFFVWFAVMVALLIVYREFFWLALPGVVTYFVLAMNLVDGKDARA